MVYCGSPKLASLGQIRETMRLFFCPPLDSPFIQVNPSNIPTHRPTGDQKRRRRNNSEGGGKPVASHIKEANRASAKIRIQSHFGTLLAFLRGTLCPYVSAHYNNIPPYSFFVCSPLSVSTRSRRPQCECVCLGMCCPPPPALGWSGHQTTESKEPIAILQKNHR